MEELSARLRAYAKLPEMDVREGQDIFADDFIRQEQIFLESTFPSEIQKFFDGSSILITGGTGFLGKILLEKLLRVCTGIQKIYLLIRPKKGKSVEERFEETFEGVVFELLKKRQPNFKTKIHMVQGDLAQDGAIICEKDQQMLIENIDVIFHCAATVRFDEKIRQAVNINIKATKFFLDLAREMKKLKAFLHVSTAYSNCPSREIGEEFYPAPFDYKKITGLLDVLDDNLLDRLTPDMIDKWPNTYAFTKIIGENTVKEYGKGLPIAILRPSIVISTFKEPITGWINNFYGPQGVVFGAGMGLLRTLHCDPNNIADMVPVDLVINALIALAWDLGQTKGDNPNFEKVSWKETSSDSNANIEKSESIDEIPILNYVSSQRNPITWGVFLDYNYRAGSEAYSTLMVWHSSLTLNSNYYVDIFFQYLCHFLPALVVDIIAFIAGKKPMMLNSYKKIHKFTKVISYFCTNQWRFKDDNVVKLWNKMSPKDKKIFNFNIEDLDWEQYFIWYLKGIRVYLGKDELSTIPQGRKKAKKLKLAHYTLVTVLNLLMVYLIWYVFSPLFS